MLSDTIKISERVKRPRMTSSTSSMPLGVRNAAHAASRYMKCKIQIESRPKTQDRGSCRSHLDEPSPIHEKSKHTARQYRVLKKFRRPLTAAHRCQLSERHVWITSRSRSPTQPSPRTIWERSSRP
jgi:hypothetical protein